MHEAHRPGGCPGGLEGPAEQRPDAREITWDRPDLEAEELDGDFPFRPREEGIHEAHGEASDDADAKKEDEGHDDEEEGQAPNLVEGDAVEGRGEALLFLLL